jgi:hypothetical protein
MKTLIKSLITMRDEFNDMAGQAGKFPLTKQKLLDNAAAIERAERVLVLLDNATEVNCGGLVMKEVYVEDLQKALR